MIDKLPPQTDLIFKELSKGRFICELSQKREHKILYNILADDADVFALLGNYFKPLNYQLESGEGYFYFSQVGEAKQDKQAKLDGFERYIDILDFLVSLNSPAAAGTTLRLSRMAEDCANQPLVKDKLQNIEGVTGDISTKIKDILRKLETAGFLEKIDDDEDNYKVLNSFNYLLNIINLIQITPDDEA